MKPTILLASCAILVATLTGCETTGDPTQGGLFGWSETKAQHRQTALRDVLLLEQDRTADARATGGNLRRTKSANSAALADERRELAQMRRELDAVERKAGRSSTASVRAKIDRASSDNDIEEAELRSQVNGIRGEVKSLRQEHGLLLEQQ